MIDQEGGGNEAPSSALDAAYQQLAKLGPAADGQSLTLSQVARVLGMSRTNLYRRWSTSAELASDIAVHRSTPPVGWHTQVCPDDGGALEDAMWQALAMPEAAKGIMARVSVAMGTDARAKARVAAWERTHVSNLAARVRREWGAGVDGPWTDIAIAITALMEGMQLIYAQFARFPGESLPPKLVDEVTQTGLRVIEFLLHEVDGVDAPIREDPSEESLEAEPVLPQRLADALADRSLDVATYGARRVVDMGILARSRGVSERSLYKRWPTPVDLNADLYLESLERTRAAFARMSLEVFQSCASGSFVNTMPVIARMNEWFMTPDRFPQAGVHLSLVDVLSRQDVLDLVREPVELRLQQGDLESAGMIQATGFRLRPDLRMRTYTLLVLGMGIGGRRVSALHPAILDRRLTYLGVKHLASGVALTAVTRSSTEPLDPPVADPTAPVPPLPPRLRSLPAAE